MRHLMMANSHMREIHMAIKAKFTFRGETMEADTVGAGEWFGKTYLIEVGIGYSSLFCVVEADNLSDAIDDLADSKYGHWITVDESCYDEYGSHCSAGDVIGGKPVERDGWVDLRGDFHGDKELEECHFSGNEVPYTLEDVVAFDPESFADVRYFGTTMIGDKEVALPEKGIKPKNFDQWRRWVEDQMES